jgi:hypothetical protein
MSASGGARRSDAPSAARSAWRSGAGPVATPEVEALAALLRAGDLDSFRARVGAGAPNLENAQLSQADLRDAPLADANLRGAYLRGADLRGLDLLDADLDGASIRDARISGVRFPRAIAASEIDLSWRLGTRMRADGTSRG